LIIFYFSWEVEIEPTCQKPERQNTSPSNAHGTLHQKLTLTILLDILLINFSFSSEFKNSELQKKKFLRFLVLLFLLKNKSQYFVKTALCFF